MLVKFTTNYCPVKSGIIELEFYNGKITLGQLKSQLSLATALNYTNFRLHFEDVYINLRVKKCSDVVFEELDSMPIVNISIYLISQTYNYAGFTRLSKNGIIFEYFSNGIWHNISYSENDIKSGHDIDCNCESSYL